MSLLRAVAQPQAHAAGAPRRGRPRARNEILRAGSFGGVDPEAIAERYGTPFYAYDFDVIRGQVEALRAVLPERFELAYAVKANPSLGVVAYLNGLGLGADVASAGELLTADRAGISRDDVVMTGPGKRDDELRSAAAARLRAITVESLGELARLERIAADLGDRVPILLRAAVPTALRMERVRLVGDDGAGKFGMNLDDLTVAAVRAARSRHLEPLGFHAFGASNVVDPGLLARHVAWTVELARETAVQAGFPLRLVDAGGGLGIAYEPDEEGLDLVGLGNHLGELDAAWSRDPVTRRTRILLEPGRFLVGPAGAYVARVIDRKSVDGAGVAILDGGIHHVLRPALVGQEHRVRRLGRHGSRRDPAGSFVPVTIAGPLCSGLDVLAVQTMSVMPDPGDLVAVLDIGAYGFTEAMPLFLSHPIPAEVAVERGRMALLRARVEPEAWIGAQHLPSWMDPEDPGREGP